MTSHWLKGGVLLLNLVALAACAHPRITIRYARPPEKEIPAEIKRVGVVIEKADDALFSEPGVVPSLTAKFEQALINNGTYQMVDRSSLAALQKEMKLSFTSWADRPNREFKVQIADALLLGTITKALATEGVGPITVLVKERRVRPGAWRNVKVGNDAQGKPIYRRERGPDEVYYETVPTTLTHGRFVVVEFGVTLKFIDAQKSQAYAVWDYRNAWDSRTAVMWQGQHFALPPNELPNPSIKIEELLVDAVEPFMRQIAPYMVEKSVILIGGSPASKQGIQFATNGMIDEAIQQFDIAATQEAPNDGPLYNKGVMLEAMGRYPEAFELFKQAYAMRNRAVYFEAMKRMREELNIQEGAQ